MSDESKDKEHYELEADDDPDSIKALDICPNCGSSLGDIKTVV